MGKIYLIIKFLFVFLLSISFTVNSVFSQTSKGTAANKSGTAAKQTNTKSIKARGIIAADMDCVVKINGTSKPVNVKAYTPSMVYLTYGINNIDASPADKKNTATFHTTIDVKDSTKQIIEISFYDEKKFLDYIKEGRVDMIETAIKRNPDYINNDGQVLASSPLQLAIVSSQFEVVKLLVNKGAKFNSPEYFFPLHKAAVYASSLKPKEKDMAPDQEMIEFFLTKGCKLNEKDDGGDTVLHAACRGLKLDLVKYLVEKGLDINAKNDFGDTPLKIAGAKGGVSIINYLKSKGAIDENPQEIKEEGSGDK